MKSEQTVNVLVELQRQAWRQKKKILKSKLASGPHESHKDPRSSLRRKMQPIQCLGVGGTSVGNLRAELERSGMPMPPPWEHPPSLHPHEVYATEFIFKAAISN